MMEYINSTSPFVLINSSSTNEFNLEKGLRQGDPLSLFFIVVEGLSFMFLFFVNVCLFKGYQIGDDTQFIVKQL